MNEKEEKLKNMLGKCYAQGVAGIVVGDYFLELLEQDDGSIGLHRPEEGTVRFEDYGITPEVLRTSAFYYKECPKPDNL